MGSKGKPDIAEHLNELREGLKRPPPTTHADLSADLQQLFPLIVPSSYFDGPFPAPFTRLPAKEFALTWVLLQPTTMLYLSASEASRFDEHHLSWQQSAFENLLVASSDAATNERRAGDGRLLWVAMLHSDGLGSSRVFLKTTWNHVFPKGYRLALPDRSCGMVIAKDITEDELSEVRKFVANLHAGATTPMSSRLYEPEELSIPPEWYPSL